MEAQVAALKEKRKGLTKLEQQPVTKKINQLLMRRLAYKDQALGRPEAEGWLNATCTYYELGWISQTNAKVALERILLQAAHFLDREEVQRAQKAALTRDPDCKYIWPVLSH